MKNIFLFCLQFFLLSLCFILIKITDTFAQEKPNKNSTLFWADAGYGYGTLKYHSVSIASLNLGINNMLYMLQIVKGGGSDKWIFANETISVFDISALVGIATLDTNMHASISGGLFYGTRKKNKLY